MIAASAGNVPVVRALLAHGADVNAVTARTGATALMWAVAAPHPDIVKVLIDAGADVHVSSEKGFTPLLFAARNGDIETAKILLAAGARVNDTGSDGTHALPLAIINRQDAVRAVPARAGRRSERRDRLACQRSTPRPAT